MLEISVPDESELQKYESMVFARASAEMLSTELCSKVGQSAMFDLLKKNDKTLYDFEQLMIKDSQLIFGQIESSNLLYLGQTRVISKAPIQADGLDYSDIVKCGYG